MLGSVFVVVVAVVGYWWHRYPRRAWVIATEGGWWVGGMTAGYAVVEQTDGGCAGLGGLHRPPRQLGAVARRAWTVAMQRFERRFPLKGAVQPGSRTEQ